MDGESGFYIPPTKGIAELKNKVLKLVNKPSVLIPFIKRKIGTSRYEIKLLDYFQAFDKVMSSDPVSDPELSSHRINYRILKEKPGVVVSIESMKKSFL